MVSKVTPTTMMSASRIPALLGLSKYRTRNDELRATIDAYQGIEQAWEGNEMTGWGNTLEPIILREAAKRLQLRDLQLEHPEARYHAELPLCCSLDGCADGGGQIIESDPDAGIYVVGADRIELAGIGALEAKTTKHYPEDFPALDRGPLQLQAQMDIIGAKWGAVCILYGGVEMRIFLFEPHAQTVAMIHRAVIEFDQKVEFWKTTKAIDWYPPESADDVNSIHPLATEESIDLPAHAAMLIADIKQAQIDVKEASSRKNKAEIALKQLLGSASEGRIGSLVVRWPMRHYKAVPASTKVIPAKEAYSVRQQTLTIKEAKK